jgi:maltooligosyltrehalose trehalohydrolase
VWADDLHHELRVGLAGDRDGYFRDFNGSVHDIVKTVEDGWFFQGQRSEHFGGPRGTDPRPVPPRRLVVCLQNHDQIGNRALGERLHHQIDAAAWRAASTLLLIAPETPLLFMGQEWGATSPFLYFTDHTAELGPLVTEGRRREFAGFAAFSDPVARERIPDPQAEQTFTKSRLDWEELGREPHAGLLRLYRALLELRRGEHLGSGERDGFHAVALDEDSLALLYGPRADAADNLVAIVRLRGSGESRLPGSLLRSEGETQWRLRLSSEDERFVSDPRLIETTADAQGLRARFSRPGAVVWSAPSSLPPRRDP